MRLTYTPTSHSSPKATVASSVPITYRIRREDSSCQLSKKASISYWELDFISAVLGLAS